MFAASLILLEENSAALQVGRQETISRRRPLSKSLVIY
jgi:hypothetical protein